MREILIPTSQHLCCVALKTYSSQAGIFGPEDIPWEQVKAMTPQEVSRMWAEYLSAMMKELQVVDRGPGARASMAESRIKLLLQEVRQYQALSKSIQRQDLQDLSGS